MGNKKTGYQDRLQLDGSGGLKTKIGEIARKERRSVPSLLRILLESAVKIYEEASDGTYLKLVAKIHQLDSKELLDIAMKAIEQYQRRNIMSVASFVQGWDLQKLEEISSIPTDRLKEIASGKNEISPNEAAGLIRAGIDPAIVSALTELKSNGK